MKETLKSNPPYRLLGLILLLLCLGAAHWVYLTWDNPRRVPRYTLTSERVAEFSWDRDKGFKSFKVIAYPGEWLGARLLRKSIAAQLKPLIARYLRQGTWSRADGDTVFAVLNCVPIVISTSLGTDAAEIRDPDETPLMVAAKKGDLEAVRNLIQTGADVNARNQNGSTALTYALRNSGSSVQTINLLASAGADVNMADREGYTVLMRAAQAGDLDAVRLLLAAGAKQDLRNHAGETALSLALSERHADVVAVLKNTKSPNP